ncbi:transporter [uncultured Stenotrophomonas sp.]|uniref:VirB4 family type IV secretion/conjugal transfer ATPase n=1 Tax=uncultured Stenotrophomonas sp. TaxID=165438 RepID=UPI0025EDB7B1|nr:transporter [uncultured Stenotrophomonas sp.]
MLNLREFRSKAKGLPDLLNYATPIEPGIVLCKNGALIAGFFFRGEDHGSTTNAMKNAAAHHMNEAMKLLGGGWVSWTETFRFQTDSYFAEESSAFTSEVPQLIEAERRATFSEENRFFKTDNAFIVMYLPPVRPEMKTGGKIKAVGDIVIDGIDDEVESIQDRVISEFKKSLQDFEDRAGNAVQIRRMTSKVVEDEHGAELLTDELVNVLRVALTGEPGEMALPACGMYMDSWMFGPDLYAGTTPKLGDKFISVVQIEGFPSHSYPSILASLNEMALPYRWSNRFIHLDAHEAEYALGRYVSKWQQRIRGFVAQMTNKTGRINADALNMTQQAEAALAEVKSREVAYGYYSSCIVLMHEDPEWLRQKSRLIKQSLQRLKFNARVETINCMEAWIGSLPGHPNANLRRPPISTRSLSHLLPLSAPWLGYPEHPSPLYPAGSPPLMKTATTGSTPFNLNLHVSDLGHTLIFGPTGGGKSTLLCMIAAQFERYPNSTIMAFDKGRSMLPLALSYGQHYDIGADHGAPQFCPLAHLDSEQDVAWAVGWIETCYELQTQRKLSPSDRNAVYGGLKQLQEKDHRSLTDFTAELPMELRQALQYYTISGPMGHMLDAKQDGLHDSRFNVIEIDDLMKQGEEASLPVLRYLFRRFEKTLKGQPAMLILDEAWIALGHPVFREALRMWLKELRKANCAVVLATQSLSDAANSGILDVLRESCPTKIFLPNVDAEQDASLYRSFRLNASEIRLIARAKPKREYYYKSNAGCRIFNMRVGPLALAFVGASDKESVQMIREFHTKHGHGWHRHWLEHKGIPYKQYLTTSERRVA